MQVFEEARNLCLGLASRGVDWQLQGFKGSVAIFITLGTKLFSNLMARCGHIAQAMQARGFRGAGRHAVWVPPRGAASSAPADLLLLASLAGLLGACYLGV